MNYHNITTDDMLNGEGLRTVLWVAGCNHYCKNCQNPETWPVDSGLPFTQEAEQELFAKLVPSYIAGITFSGGDPLYPDNRETIEHLCKKFKKMFPYKDIWMYTGYLWEEVKDLDLVQSYVDVLVEGPFIEELSDINYPWAGSTNQRVIDVFNSLLEGTICLWKTK